MSEAKMASRISHNNGIKTTIVAKTVHKWVLGSDQTTEKREKQLFILIFTLVADESDSLKLPGNSNDTRDYPDEVEKID